MKTTNPPRLRHIANLWSLTEYPSAGREWTLERKMEAIKDAGFDGFTTNLLPAHKRLAKKLDLIPVGFFSSSRASEFKPLLQQNQRNGARFINVQLADEDTSPATALRLTLRLMKEARALGVEPAVEIHRDTCTETPEKTYALADAYRKETGEYLPMTLDFSHLAVVKHLHPGNYAQRLLVQPRLIQRVEQMHLRPFNGHHCQVPVTNGRGRLTPEVRDWLPFVEDLFRVWRGGRQEGRELFVCPEMGPIRGGYNLHGLPNSWEDAVVLRGRIEKAWKASAGPR